MNKSNKELRENGAICFWSWNDALEKDELIHQMRDFAEKRFSGVVIHARAGLSIPYLSEEWFNCYQWALEEAEKLGLEVWIYDENGWPSGSAGGKVDSLGEKYEMKSLSFSFGKVPDNGKIVAVYRKHKGEYIRIADEQGKKNDLFCFYVIEKDYVDLLSKDTVKRFIEFTHEEYKKRFSKYFGTVVKGFFTDEPQVKVFPWSEKLADVWHERHGNELCDSLWLLFDNNPQSKQFNKDYRTLVNDLLYENFTLQLSDWCAENGLMLTGHFATEDGLYSQMISNDGVMKQYSCMQLPGIDHLGNRNTSPVLEKQVSSVALQFDKNSVLSETFGCSGWNLTFSDIAYIWGRQSALGITKPCFHLSAYSMLGRRKRDYPAFFSYQSVWWEQFPELMKWVDGLNEKMTEGERLTDILVISPLESVKMNFAIGINDAKAREYSNEYRALLENLIDIQLDFELGDESYISDIAYVGSDAALHIGKRAYRTVIVPCCEVLKESTLTLLKSFSEAGGKIYFINGKPLFPKDFESVFDKCKTVRNYRHALLMWSFSEGIRRYATVSHKESGNLSRGVFIHSRSIKDGKRYHIWTDRDFAAENALIRINDVDLQNKAVYLLDLQSDERELIPFKLTDTGVMFTLPLTARDNKVIELSEYTDGKQFPFVVSAEKLYDDCKVLLRDPNVLTLDYNSISIDGSEFNAAANTVKQLDFLYSQLEKNSKQSSEIIVRYFFECDKELITDGIKLAAETKYASGLMINGNSISLRSDEYWVDKSIRLYNIGEFIKTGINYIDIQFPVSSEKGLEYGFESVRNRFFYKVEPEAVYILGDFDVNTRGTVKDSGYMYSVENKGFVLTESKKKSVGELTAQGMWFYRGSVEYRFELEHRTVGKRTFIKIEDANAAAVKILINGHSKTVIFTGLETEITDMLVQGSNEICVLLIGTNRNLLGPHHHIKGITAMVGPNTFEGKLGFEDFVNPEIKTLDTLTDNYSFIPFGCNGFRVITRK